MHGAVSHYVMFGIVINVITVSGKLVTSTASCRTWTFTKEMLKNDQLEGMIHFFDQLVAVGKHVNIETEITMGGIPERCEDGWSEHNSKCYRFFQNNPTNWSNARKQCDNMESDLVTINDEEENYYLLSQHVNGGFWIGLNKGSADGDFEWVEGTPINFTNWGESQPNDGKDNENCCVLEKTGKWHDYDCDNFEFGYICEKRRKMG